MTIRIMKKLAYILLTLVATVMSLTACSDDYTPILTSTIAPELYDYTGDTIKSGNSVYTLNWSPIRFYTDNQTSPTSIGSYELQGVNYNIQIDTLGGDFSSAAVLGSVVGKCFYNFSYDDVETAVTEQLAIQRSATDSIVPVIIRLQAVYASNADAGAICSNAISLPFVLGAAQSSLPKIYIHDNAGYTDLYLYAWAGSGDVKDPWPGIHHTGMVSIDGIDYYQFDLSREYINESINLIVNDNNGRQQDLMQNFVLTQNTYITLNADGTYTYK